MSFPFFSREDQRRLLAAAFEETEDGFLFYRNRWSGGIPVTPAEREEYLNLPALASRRGFYRKIEGRPEQSRRKYESAIIANAFPAGWPLGLVAAGGLFLLLGILAKEGLPRWLHIGAGIMTILFGLWLFLSRDSKKP